MKNNFKAAFIASFLVMWMLASSAFFSSYAYAEEAPDIQADAAIAVELSTGKIVYEKNADALLGIASMTKMMSEYLLFEAISEKKVSWDQTYQVNEHTYKISQDLGLSNVPLRRDGTYTIQELYEAMAIYSANAATMAIAETIAGSEGEFVKMMNEKGTELGLGEFQFVNSTGLNNSDLKGMHPEGTSPEDDNMMSARATAKLAMRLLTDYPKILGTASTPQMTFQDGTTDAIVLQNTNLMLPSLIYDTEGVDGLKTGFTDFAGYCFTGTAERNGVRIITVVMNAKDENGKTSNKARFDATKELMEYVFQHYDFVELFPANYQLDKKSSLPVKQAKRKKVDIHTDQPLSVFLKKSDKDSYEAVLKVDKQALNEEEGVTAPIKKGTVVGSLTAQSKEGDPYGYLNDKPSVNVIIKDDVKKAGWFTLMMRSVGEFFTELWNNVTK